MRACLRVFRSLYLRPFLYSLKPLRSWGHSIHAYMCLCVCEHARVRLLYVRVCVCARTPCVCVRVSACVCVLAYQSAHVQNGMEILDRIASETMDSHYHIEVPNPPVAHDHSLSQACRVRLHMPAGGFLSRFHALLPSPFPCLLALSPCLSVALSL